MSEIKARLIKSRRYLEMAHHDQEGVAVGINLY